MSATRAGGSLQTLNRTQITDKPFSLLKLMYPWCQVRLILVEMESHEQTVATFRPYRLYWIISIWYTTEFDTSFGHVRLRIIHIIPHHDILSKQWFYSLCILLIGCTLITRALFRLCQILVCTLQKNHEPRYYTFIRWLPPLGHLLQPYKTKPYLMHSEDAQGDME